MSEKGYTKNKLVLFGGIGAALVALCCFTPVLVLGLTALGAAAVLAYLDFVLLPLLVVFVVITYVGIEQVRRRYTSAEQDCCEVPGPKPNTPVQHRPRISKPVDKP